MNMKSSILLVFCVSAAAFFVAGATSAKIDFDSNEIQTNRPVFGIISVPDNDEDKASTISGSYVKFLESAGARVVAIPYNSPPSLLSDLFYSVNAIFLPGGALSLLPNSTFYKTAKMMMDLASEEWERGVNFPIHGTCMGFQLLSVLVAESHDVLLSNAFDSENLPLPLTFTPETLSSRMFRQAPPHILSILSSQNVTMNLHHDGVPPAKFSSNQNLNRKMKVLATNVDRKNSPFVSVMEGREMPIYGVQYHPERNAFEWEEKEDLPHSFVAVLSAQYIANFLVQEARKNDHSFAKAVERNYGNIKNEEEKKKKQRELEKHMIYHFTPKFTGDETGEGWIDEQTYYFD